jgi:hypothetical protein
MTKEDLIKFVSDFYETNIEILKKKNADYSGGNEDALINFKALEMISGIKGISEIGLITRMFDKMMRIISHVKTDNWKVKV